MMDNKTNTGAVLNFSLALEEVEAILDAISFVQAMVKLDLESNDLLHSVVENLETQLNEQK